MQILASAGTEPGRDSKVRVSLGDGGEGEGQEITLPVPSRGSVVYWLGQHGQGVGGRVTEWGS